jgi:hypothetical protein
MKVRSMFTYNLDNFFLDFLIIQVNVIYANN